MGSSSPELVAVAAVDETLAIGLEGELPWPSIPADKRQYRQRVADAVVVLGRRTFESMRDDLPGRTQVVLSRGSYDPDVSSAIHAPDIETALSLVRRYDDEAAYVLGGATVYELFMPHLDRMVLSRVPGRHEADAYFPRWDPDEWTRVTRRGYPGFVLEEWIRADSED